MTNKRKRWLPTKFPLLLARRRARADSFENIRSYQENLHSCFSSESSVPRALADRFVRVKSIYYLVPGIFLFDETLWMVCCIVSVWKTSTSTAISSYVEVKREPYVVFIVDASETSVAPVSPLEPSAPLKGLHHHIPERLGKDTLPYGP
ncbi:hypothetical protein GEV33_004219 [Tenebrio molitor]|uniref:Uncharacterized protein n=1 Tax=Tenebrio molitor TaxID=7067 RepID=A0A8J6LG94_TENMO|nr:hypothetical protein GEV33_004219 [Tenebrio molitor]